MLREMPVNVIVGVINESKKELNAKEGILVKMIFNQKSTQILIVYLVLT